METPPAGVAIDRVEIRTAIARHLDIAPESIADDTDLIELGLDSIRTMKLAGGWRKRGIATNFALLAAHPTVDAWFALLNGVEPSDVVGTAAPTPGVAPHGSSSASGDAALAADVGLTDHVAAPVADRESGRVPLAGGAVPSVSGSGGGAPNVGAVDDDGAPFALAPMQHAYWIGRSEAQELGGVAAHLYVEFDGGEVDPVRLGKAVDNLVARHPMLRTRFLADGTQQTLARPGREVFSVNDLRALSGDAVDARLAELRDARTHQRLAVEDGQVIDIALTQLPGSRSRVHLDVDMLAADAMSYRILVSDLARLYQGETLPPQHYTFRQYLADTALPTAPTASATASAASASPTAASASALAKPAMPIEPATAPPSPTTAAHPSTPALAAIGVTAAAALVDERARDRDWWRSRLTELPGAPELPQVQRVAEPNRTVRLHHWLDADAKARLFSGAHARGITPAMALASVFAETIGGWSAQRRFLLNLPLFHRQPVHPQVDGVVGDFTSSVLLEVDVTETQTVVERARALQKRLHEAGAHSAYSGLDVLRDLGRHRGEPVLAPIVYTSALNLGELFADEVAATFGEPVWIISQGPQVLLDAQITEVRGGLLLNWDIRESAFPTGMVDEMFARYVDAIERLAGDARADMTKVGQRANHVGDAGWQAEAAVRIPVSQAAIRAQVNATGGPISGALLHTGFSAHAATTPNAPAVRSNTNGHLTYGELAAAALAVAGALQAAGVTPGDTVAVQLPKGPDQIVAVIGVLAAGATYVPIGFNQPEIRRNEILDIAGARALLTTGLRGLNCGAVDQPATCGDEVSESPEATTLLAVRNPGPNAADQPAASRDANIGTNSAATESAVRGRGLATINLATARRAHPIENPIFGNPRDLAYILFTSGSTGKPKGVEVSHHAAMNTIDDLNDRFGIGADDRALALSALEFDLSVYDIFGLLSAGGTVVTVDDTERANPATWVETIVREQVSLLNCVPSLLDMLLTTAADTPLDSLRTVILGGDRVDTALPARLKALAPNSRFAGLGGATEAAIHSTICEVVDAQVDPDWTCVPYGTPLRNVACRVVGPAGTDCPDWVTGELWIGGDGVANGYRGDPERTADRFVTHDGLRWYRTGDLARYLPDGTIDFLGRADHQVKIRGYRVELGEVENALRSVDGVHHAVAALVGTAAPKLVAAVVPEAGEQLPDVDAILTKMAHLVPSYMVPTRIECLAELPLTSNGKPDRKAVLALLDTSDSAEEFVGPRTDLEHALASIVAEVLATERISVTADFFALGGDSVLATTAIARIREWLDAPDTVVADLFMTRTIAGLATRLLDRETEQGATGRLDAVANYYLEVAALTDEQILAES
ncbi:non-ribosomal peptide synthetase [Nocardia camponoti]|uniref:Phenyloxazoline synthase MbtB n=1 Tax=Nocardia camponoti TaxID=1616106 RepID=A0A917VBD1_9NOCA|nr:non-ribosomal peptide synthetase [Nocardia camponoti]GGK58768.1 hypothetical protein GCM10011591_33720 [Nocardia camponoti]